MTLMTRALLHVVILYKLGAMAGSLGVPQEEGHVKNHIFNISSDNSGPIWANIGMHDLSELLKLGAGPQRGKKREHFVKLENKNSSET